MTSKKHPEISLAENLGVPKIIFVSLWFGVSNQIQHGWYAIKLKHHVKPWWFSPGFPSCKMMHKQSQLHQGIGKFVVGKSYQGHFQAAFEKNERQNGKRSPNGGENLIKYLEPPPKLLRIVGEILPE